ncbi:MAG: S-layer homology domain-containing protein [Solibacillus sp.]|uniref:S-layer homology domain-containing protein n=1 Tax=Solibacillus sp. TaxID=1909654 RepID=UPI003315DB66
MDSKKTHKLSKATVATVLAASGVIVALPQPTNAYSFSDLNPNSDYFEPIMDLVNRKILSGYPDGTFKPNKAITREEAAKMLAQTLNVNISNPSNPRFKDVPMSNSNYRYIAALVEAGVINGFPDNTFKPKEPITRAQMAKIITLGFKLGVSTKLNHGFKDVSSDHPNAYFIQTMLDLNITKGTSIVTFEPFKTVTRGQMATFIWRAENADRGNPTYTVGDVTGDKIYINGVAHTIAPHLRSILNASNKNILKGAFIEGTYSGTTLTNISKLTINASGTSSRLLALDGSYTSFAGELIINGSYLRFKNINFTGRVEVATAPRRTLAALENVRVASIGTMASFIDWNKPTEPNNEDFLNPSDDETLQDKPDPNKPPHLQPYKERMANIKQYIDFDSSDIRNLYISGDRAFVKSNYDIDRLTVNGDVTNMELYADVNAMYVDTDYNVTFFGENDIKYVYKNTLKNVFFNTNSVYEYYYVTNSNGYTNIGDHVIIDNAIIPPGKTVNDIFDDYKTDDPNIGWIEDSDGKPVDRDPIDNTVIPDVTSPEILQLDVKAGGTVADVTLTANENGTYYYIVQKADLKPPSINEIKTGGKKHSGSGKVIMDEPVTFQVTDLESLTEYTIYAIVIDGADNVSNKKDKDFKTVDSKPPTLKLSGEGLPGGKRIKLKITPSEAGTYYYYIRPINESHIPLTVDNIIEKHTNSAKVTEPGTVEPIEHSSGSGSDKNQLIPKTKYEVLAVMVDASGNKSTLVEKITVETAEKDEIYPYVTNSSLLRDTSNKTGNVFYLTVNEKLDKDTVLDVNNYILSGTGIVNVDGQTTIKPSEVTYDEKNNRIYFKIPSLTGFIKGDTLRVTVLPGVKDLADNPFISEDTFTETQPLRNYAEYIHEDNQKPVITIDNIIENIPQDKYEVEVTPTKAGTYYYMILPENYFDGKNITSRDFVDEFSTEAGVATDKFNQRDAAGNVIVDTNGRPLKDYKYKEGDKAAPLSTFKFDVSRPSGLDPFTPYSIYVVLKDRSGQLSEIVGKTLIKDTKPPLVSDILVKPIVNNDKAVNLSVNVNEKSTFFIMSFRKYVMKNGVRVLNDEIFNADGTLKVIADVDNLQLSDAERKAKFLAAKGTTGRVQEFSTERQGVYNIPITGLDPHEEYVTYVGVEDTFKNFTVRQRSSSTITTNEPAGDQMIEYFYTDGTKPKIEDIIYRDFGAVGGDLVLNITFSESILRQEGTLNNGVVTGFNSSLFENSSTRPNLSDVIEITTNNGTTNLAGNFSYVDGGYTVAADGKATLKLKVSPTVITDRILKIRLKTPSITSYDYKNSIRIQNEFDLEDFGYYYSPDATKINKLTYAGLGSPLIGSGTQSKTIVIEYNLDATHVGEFSTTPPTPTPIKKVEQEYYYAILANDPGVSDEKLAEEIKKAAKGNASSIIMTYAGVITMTGANDITGRREITIPNTNGNTFQAGQRVYLYTLDNYGNIIWAYQADPANGNVTNIKYRIITQ